MVCAATKPPSDWLDHVFIQNGIIVGLVHERYSFIEKHMQMCIVEVRSSIIMIYKNRMKLAIIMCITRSDPFVFDILFVTLVQRRVVITVHP